MDWIVSCVLYLYVRCGNHSSKAGSVRLPRDHREYEGTSPIPHGARLVRALQQPLPSGRQHRLHLHHRRFCWTQLSVSTYGAHICIQPHEWCSSDTFLLMVMSLYSPESFVSSVSFSTSLITRISSEFWMDVVLSFTPKNLFPAHG